MEYVIYLTRGTSILIIFLVAMTLTNVSAFLNFIGSAAGITLIYIFPVLSYNLYE